MRSRIGLVVGPLLAILVWCLPMPLEDSGHRLAGLMIWVVTWWISETIPLAVTSVLAAAAAVALGVTDAKTAFAPFGHKLIMNLLCGAVILIGPFALHSLRG